MAVVVRNERSDAFYINEGSSSAKKRLDPGITTTLSDDEWQSVTIGLRGPGGINPLAPTEADSSNRKVNLEYYTPFSTVQLRYYGANDQSAADTDQTWLVRRFDHTQVTPDDIRVEQIQIFEGVAWADRATLPWV